MINAPVYRKEDVERNSQGALESLLMRFPCRYCTDPRHPWQTCPSRVLPRIINAGWFATKNTHLCFQRWKENSRETFHVYITLRVIESSRLLATIYISPSIMSNIIAKLYASDSSSWHSNTFPGISCWSLENFHAAKRVKFGYPLGQSECH